MPFRLNHSLINSRPAWSAGALWLQFILFFLALPCVAGSSRLIAGLSDSLVGKNILQDLDISKCNKIVVGFMGRDGRTVDPLRVVEIGQDRGFKSLLEAIARRPVVLEHTTLTYPSYILIFVDEDDCPLGASCLNLGAHPDRTVAERLGVSVVGGEFIVEFMPAAVLADYKSRWGSLTRSEKYKLFNTRYVVLSDMYDVVIKLLRDPRTGGLITKPEIDAESVKDGCDP